MGSDEKTFIAVRTLIKAPIDIVWKFWTTPEHFIEYK